MNEHKRNWFMVGTKGGFSYIHVRVCSCVQVTFVGKVGITFMSVVTVIFFLSKGLKYVLCLCRLMMYAVVREFILMILSNISKCTNQCDFLVWAFCEQCVFYLV